MTKVVYDSIPSIGDRYKLTLENSIELTVVNLTTGDHEIYIGDSKIVTLTSKDTSVLISVLTGALPALLEGDGS